MPHANLLDLITSRIRQDGPMDMGDYMTLCLGHPQFGYYMTRDPFGVAGDFTTAPEISQIFGEMIGVWLADLWQRFGAPKEFVLLECGPGRGTLMEDVLRATKSVPGFHDSMKLHLLEMSPVLREAQKQKLGIYDPVWIDDVTQLERKLKQPIPVFVVANEFLDALPVRQLVSKRGVWYERVVGLENDTVCEGLKQADESFLELLPPAIRTNKEEGVYEVSPILNQFVKLIVKLLKKQTGCALFLDYGHMRTAMGDTLQAVKKHEFVSIFDTPGLSDLTAHVDFENVGRIAKRDGVAIHGPITQGAFLKNLGIEIRAQKLLSALECCASPACGADTAQAEMLVQGLKRLIDTDQMGELFKVMALCHDMPEPAGF